MGGGCQGKLRERGEERNLQGWGSFGPTERGVEKIDGPSPGRELHEQRSGEKTASVSPEAAGKASRVCRGKCTWGGGAGPVSTYALRNSRF